MDFFIAFVFVSEKNMSLQMGGQEEVGCKSAHLVVEYTVSLLRSWVQF
jgi:hypothetical protein